MISNRYYQKAQEAKKVQGVTVAGKLGVIPARLITTYEDGTRVSRIISEDVGNDLRAAGIPVDQT